jgi:hypothetical protein
VSHTEFVLGGEVDGGVVLDDGGASAVGDDEYELESNMTA